MSTRLATAESPAARRFLQLGIIWALLLTVPLWLPLLGGYTAMAGRVLVFALEPFVDRQGRRIDVDMQ